MAKVFAAVMYGQGGKAVDAILSGDGIGALVRRLRTISNVDCPGPFTWDAGVSIRDAIRRLPPETRVVIGGTSLGANETPMVCSMVHPRRVDFIFGIQPSLYGRKNVVPGNVVKALCVHAPIWAFWTMGFGSHQWTYASKLTTRHSMTSYMPHPGDNDPRLHDVIAAEVRRLAA